ncbi:uncharacterized protein FA14DRAFT_153881 [Meira miltonrushii]|uniref:Uncharacterized protein n=1 Tax=Meira miltonrushii TaxID=1280837 RepID=A0A316VLR4_9BASI|nr:uncharacterized protein FA14DRAFT_153881 [Meira miltonrushii]PWN38559.1 hypothetical protein FA14DRAFT_153881 [Meira miltonrushii]
MDSKLERYKKNLRLEPRKETVHWRHLLKNPSLVEGEPKHRQFTNTDNISKDSNKYLNIRAEKFRQPIRNLERYTQAELPPGHTRRQDFIPLRNSRDRTEDRVNGALVAGILLSKENKGVSHSLLHYAQEQRLKSLDKQKSMNDIVNQGQINEDILRQNKHELGRANKDEHDERISRLNEAYNRRMRLTIERKKESLFAPSSYTNAKAYADNDIHLSLNHNFVLQNQDALRMLSLDFPATSDHWTNYVPNRNENEHDPADAPPNDSHRILNRKSKVSKIFRHDYIRSEIPLGHTSRKEFIPLLDQPLIAGLALHRDKNKSGVSKALMNHAYEHRLKSQEIQRQMDHIKSQGHINEFQASMDLHHLNKETHHRVGRTNPDYKQRRRQQYERKRAREQAYIRHIREGKKRKSKEPDQDIPPSQSNN